MNKVIQIAGVSGVGKSTLAEHIAKTHNLPFITSSTKPLWPKYGINTHEELIKKTIEDNQWGIDFQFEVLEYREKIGNENPAYVTDRSPIDNLVYFLMQNSYAAGPDVTLEYITKCVQLLRKATHIIYLELTPDVPMINDGMRITNQHYQIMTDAIFNKVINVYFSQDLRANNKKLLQIGGWDWDKRCQAVAKYISNIIIVKG